MASTNSLYALKLWTSVTHFLIHICLVLTLSARFWACLLHG